MTLTVLRRPELADDLMMLPADLQDVNIEYFPGHSQPHYLTPVVEASTTLDAPARFTASHSITNLDDSRLEPPTCEAPPVAPPDRHEPTWTTSAGYAEPYQSPPIYYTHQPAYGEPYSYPAESWALPPPGAGSLLWSSGAGPEPTAGRPLLGACQTDYGQPPPAAWSDGRDPSPPAWTADGREPSPPRPLGAESATPPQQYWSPPATTTRDPRATSPAFFSGPMRSPAGARYTLADVRVQRTGRAPFAGAEAGGSRRRNRRQKGQPKIGKLWQFLLALLHDKSHNPSMIKWDDFEQGRFKFVQSEAVARLWGSRKGYETNMTYEKLSRAMRYYYKPGILEPVVGRRLVYAFGPNADWKTPPDVSLA